MHSFISNLTLRSSLLLALHIAASPLALAQSANSDNSDTRFDPLDPVVVVATRAPEPLSKIGNSVTVLTQATIVDSQTVVISDLLAQTPGLNVARNGGIGGITSVFIRGAESGQTLVRIDGVSFDDPTHPDSGFDFANLYTGDITRIEILRGAHSALYGSQAIGGVIDISTAAPSKDLAGTYSAEGGSKDTWLTNAGMGGTVGDLGWRLSGQHFQTGGIPDFDKNFGGTTRDRSSNNSFSGKLSYALNTNWSVNFNGYYVRARSRFDGYDTPTGAFGNDLEFNTVMQAIGYAGLKGSSLNGQLHHQLSAQVTETDRESFDPMLTPINETYYGYGNNRRFEYQGNWDFNADNHLVFGVENARARLNTDSPAYDFGAPGLSRASAQINSGYGEFTSTLVKDLTVSLGARVDNHSAFGRHTTAEASAAYSLNQGNTILRSSFGQGFKAPSLYQLYSQYGNTALRPESSSNWDAGIEQHFWTARAWASATYFQRDSRNLIGFFSCSTPSPLCATEPFGYYANINGANVRGVELQTTLPLSEALTFNANYTYMTDLDRSAGASTYGLDLPRRPRQLANASLSWCATQRLTATAAIRQSGPAFDDAANTIKMGGYYVVDLRASYQLSPRWDVYGRVENSTDRQYEVAYLYGTLGRGFFVGTRYSL